MRVSAAVQARWVRRVKPALFVAGLAPFAWLIFRVLTGRLSPEPIEDITFATGDWGLRFLLITLAVTPVRAITGFNALIRLRRMLGLFAFFYIGLHFAVYIVLEQFFDWSAIAEDITERTYILVGFAGFVMLAPLAVTSTDAMLKRLGARRWKRLHKLAYAAAVAGVLHFLWLVKSDVTEPVIYIAILACSAIGSTPAPDRARHPGQASSSWRVGSKHSRAGNSCRPPSPRDQPAKSKKSLTPSGGRCPLRQAWFGLRRMVRERLRKPSCGVDRGNSGNA